VSDDQKLWRGIRTGITLGLILLASGICAGTCAAQSDKSLPIVTSASVPFYPRVPQTAHIEGVVKLRIWTDGIGVSSAKVESGPVMLGKTAEENIKSWKFEQHTPTTFEVTFRYVLLPSKCDPGCRCDDTEHPTVVLHLPSLVEVSAKRVMTCDPVENR